MKSDSDHQSRASGVCVDTAATPSAQWRAKGEPDPHGNRYDCERASLCMGDLSDDELANEVFLRGDGKTPIGDIVSGKALPSIAYLTAAKDRIRWLSRKLEEASDSVAASQSPNELALSHQRLKDALRGLVEMDNAGMGVDGWDEAFDAARAALEQAP